VRLKHTHTHTHRGCQHTHIPIPLSIPHPIMLSSITTATSLAHNPAAINNRWPSSQSPPPSQSDPSNRKRGLSNHQFPPKVHRLKLPSRNKAIGPTAHATARPTHPSRKGYRYINSCTFLRRLSLAQSPPTTCATQNRDSGLTGFKACNLSSNQNALAHASRVYDLQISPSLSSRESRLRDRQNTSEGLQSPAGIYLIVLRDHIQCSRPCETQRLKKRGRVA